MGTVLEDCTDQLAVLGRIMPVSYEERPDAEEVSYPLCFRLLKSSNSSSGSSSVVNAINFVSNAGLQFMYCSHIDMHANRLALSACETVAYIAGQSQVKAQCLY